jgi:hypothetical protein
LLQVYRPNLGCSFHALRTSVDAVFNPAIDFGFDPCNTVCSEMSSAWKFPGSLEPPNVCFAVGNTVKDFREPY